MNTNIEPNPENPPVKQRICRWWHKVAARHSFRVIYTDEGRTVRMDYQQARNLAEVFGGQVVFDPRTAREKGAAQS